MRVKTTAQQRPELPTPPLALRLWDDPSWWQLGKGLGSEVYADRQEWIAARREWETRHRITIAGWFRLVCDDAFERGGLAGGNQVFSEYLVDDEDDLGDPRVAA